MIDLRELRLEDALALLGHGAAALPDSAKDDQAYVQAVIDRLCELSLKDPLTGLSNRRYFFEALRREIEVVTRSGEPALLLMLDIDHFKCINDTYGHPVGDVVIRSIAQTLAGCVRPMDTVARFGGEEFVIILPSCQGHFGIQVAERIRESVAAMNIMTSSGVALKVTISIGGAFAPRWVRSTPELWLDRADIELYRAKSEGRNRVCIEPQPLLSVSAEEKSLLFGSLSLEEPAAWMDGMMADPAGAGSAASTGSTITRVN
ncbi:GGDEF domain-containing protein [Candidatus Symbiobacter mobilis]|uniref:diguanylate cyclase n=1 Tax=Candidatus Symbiobacter mobilis CR TaxID=946483 RepID=U5N6J0_9BURK|nr:GGDEF domain-containing protein [Candidatus Symbiobacter mobilis]AGX86885.1 GGDEF domain protein [Candidatus Symbiobacter mobilis CR]